MQGMPDPTAFDQSKMAGQAENARANMGNARHEEQLPEAARAKREAEKGKADTLLKRLTQWFRRRR